MRTSPVWVALLTLAFVAGACSISGSKRSKRAKKTNPTGTYWSALQNEFRSKKPGLAIAEIETRLETAKEEEKPALLQCRALQRARMLDWRGAYKDSRLARSLFSANRMKDGELRNQIHRLERIAKAERSVKGPKPVDARTCLVHADRCLQQYTTRARRRVPQARPPSSMYLLIGPALVYLDRAVEQDPENTQARARRLMLAVRIAFGQGTSGRNKFLYSKEDPILWPRRFAQEKAERDLQHLIESDPAAAFDVLFPCQISKRGWAQRDISVQARNRWVHQTLPATGAGRSAGGSAGGSTDRGADGSADGRSNPVHAWFLSAAAKTPLRHRKMAAFNRVVQNLEAVIRARPDDLGLRLALVETWLEKKLYTPAEAAFDSLLKRRPAARTPAVRQRLRQVASRMAAPFDLPDGPDLEDLGLTRAEFTQRVHSRVLESYPDPAQSFAIYKARALSRMARREWAGALQDLELCLKTRPDDLDLLSKRGDVKAAMKDIEGAFEDHRRVFLGRAKKKPRWRAGYTARSMLAKMRRYSRGKAHAARTDWICTQQLRTRSRDAQVLHDRGWARLQLKKYQDARKDLLLARQVQLAQRSSSTRSAMDSTKDGLRQVATELGEQAPVFDAFKMTSIKIYEGPRNATGQARTFGARFDSAKTRYIHAWVVIENEGFGKSDQQIALSWKFVPNNGSKTRAVNSKVLQLSSTKKSMGRIAWNGSKEPGTWPVGKYRVDIYANGKKLGQAGFEVFSTLTSVTLSPSRTTIQKGRSREFRLRTKPPTLRTTAGQWEWSIQGPGRIDRKGKDGARVTANQWGRITVIARHKATGRSARAFVDVPKPRYWTKLRTTRVGGSISHFNVKNDTPFRLNIKLEGPQSQTRSLGASETKTFSVKPGTYIVTSTAKHGNFLPNIRMLELERGVRYGGRLTMKDNEGSSKPQR